MAESPSKISSPKHIIEGQWTGTSSYTSNSANFKGNFCDANHNGITREIEVKPIEEQGPMESRKVWQTVAEGIRKGDFDNATAAKTKLEVGKRVISFSWRQNKSFTHRMSKGRNERKNPVVDLHIN